MHINLSSMHRETCERLGTQTALRYRQDGLYRDLCWADYRKQADLAAAGLISLGIQPGDRIAILSENRYEWLVADHAILSTAAVNVPLHAPLAPQQVAYQVSHSGSRGIIVSGRNQADKVIAVQDELSELEWLISFDPIDRQQPGCSESPGRSLRVLSWDDLKQLGSQSLSETEPEIDRREASLTTDDPATIIYTSGTTGNPKGVVLTHGNLLSNAAGTWKVQQDVGQLLLSWLPYSHIYARTVDHYLTTLAGMTMALSESIDALVDDLQEIQPTWMTAVPRFYEKVWTKVEHLPPEERTGELWDVFGPNIKQLCSGGAPLPRHVCEGFHEAGLMLLEGYGLTESSPVISFNRLDSFRIGTVGQAIPDVEIRIAPDGEILTRGPHVMKGYWNNSNATAETILDGWLQTGDVGEIDDDGFLEITDRKKDLIVTSSGKNVAPSEIERLLISDPFIDQAVLYGDGCKFISALLVPNFENLAELTEKNGWNSNCDGEFLTEPHVVEFYEQRVTQLMQVVSNPERVRKFLLLSRAFQVEADELTATLKVRRRHIIGKFESQLTALYQD
jgi:long-chain acyl-CoA synthetase